MKTRPRRDSMAASPGADSASPSVRARYTPKSVVRVKLRN
jgi:hypothetical protein